MGDSVALAGMNVAIVDLMCPFAQGVWLGLDTVIWHDDGGDAGKVCYLGGDPRRGPNSAGALTATTLKWGLS